MIYALRGNTIRDIALPLEELVVEESGSTVSDYYPTSTDKIEVNMISASDVQTVDVTVDGKYLHWTWLPEVTGLYGIEVKIVQENGTHMRSYRKAQIRVYNSNDQMPDDDGEVEFISEYLVLDAVTVVWVKGDPGNGIVSITKTSTVGLVDTYTITYTDSDPTTFTVTNGQDATLDPAQIQEIIAEVIAAIDIPTALSDLTEDSTHRTVTDEQISTWNAKGTYSKPVDGIPASDLASGVQTSLGKADTAVQPAAISDMATESYVGTAVGAEETRAKGVESGLQDAIGLINAKIPSAASAQNQLADKNWVNSSISTNTATFKGTYTSLADLQQVTATNNDYAFVIETDSVGNEYYDRYKYVAGTGWVYEYKVESTPFTSDQWAAIQSGITSALVTKIGTALQPTDIIDALNSGSTTSALSANQGKVLNESKQDVIDATHKLPYSYLSGTPTIPSALSDLSDDSTHRVVTDTEIAAWDNKASKVLVNNHGTDDTTYSVTPNTLHIWGTVASLTLTLATPTDATIVNEYMIEFTSGSTATTLSLPSSVEWAESCGALSVEASKTYQISIVNNIGLWASIANN